MVMLVVVDQGKESWNPVKKNHQKANLEVLVESKAAESSINSIGWVLSLKVTADLCRKSFPAAGKGGPEGS